MNGLIAYTDVVDPENKTCPGGHRRIEHPNPHLTRCADFGNFLWWAEVIEW